MHFTLTKDEEFMGAEMCCDLCNKLAKAHTRLIGNTWFYVRYNVTDLFPSLWICNDCKEELQ